MSTAEPHDDEHHDDEHHDEQHDDEQHDLQKQYGISAAAFTSPDHLPQWRHDHMHEFGLSASVKAFNTVRFNSSRPIRMRLITMTFDYEESPAVAIRVADKPGWFEFFPLEISSMHANMESALHWLEQVLHSPTLI